MPHRAAPTSRWLLLAALATAPTVVFAQTAAKSAVSPRAFTAGVAAVKAQADAFGKQTATQASRTEKALAATQAARAKITDTAAKKDEVAATDAKIATEKKQAAFRLKVSSEAAVITTATSLASSAATTAGAGVCSSDTKGVKPQLVAAKRAADGIVGSVAAEIESARAEEKKQTPPGVKRSLAAYARDLQGVAKAASAISASLKKLAEQAATFPPCR